jgi:hypothetical protein
MSKAQETTLRSGALLVAIGIAGYLDDSDLLPHPPWLIVVAAIGSASVVAAIRTVKRLVRPDHT